MMTVLTPVPCSIFFFQAEDGIRDKLVTGVQTCALPISWQALRKTKLAIDENRQRRLIAAQERGQDIFVERGAEAEQKAGNDAGPGERKGDAPECLPRTLAQIEGRFLEIPVEPLEPGDHHQHRIR